MVHITLPDGRILDFPTSTTALEVAATIGAGLAKATIAAYVNDVLQDARLPITTDANIRIVTNKDPAALEIIRHSCAHLLGHAVKQIFPNAKMTIGPVVEKGFYYDIACSESFSPDTLDQINKRMAELIAQDYDVDVRVVTRDEARRVFKERDEPYKLEIIDSIPDGETIKLYYHQEYIDMCRGPHVPNTRFLKAFKLMKLAGAYWRGDSEREMLQRVYGTAWINQKELDQYLFQLAEAEKRDHRRIGKQLDWFHTQEEAPGMIFWHPKGWSMVRVLEDYIRTLQIENGYLEIKTPQIIDRKLWEKSGHWEKFKDDMFTTSSEHREFAVKPMNCPGHIQVFNQGIKSYRDLPIRFAEFGACHRNEPSGTLHGLMRVRHFTQDDAHIFCTPDQVQSEVSAFID
ncbi:MAG: threonine--tRNA ligase, partial [Pseudomonadota bacterium]